MANIVFIGGTGRCGTNILKNLFSKHPKVATLPFEHRFLIDPDGIVDFYSTFSQSWSPFMADKRLKRLENLLNEVSNDKIFHKALKKIIFLINKEGKFISPKKYIDWKLTKYFPNFKKHNEKLVSKLREFTYRGIWPGTDSYTFKPQIYHSGPKTKEKLAEIFGNYLRDIIQDFLLENNKEFFFEDNTWNIFFARELLELLPESKVIHIFRDPRDVVASFSQQRWCPGDRKKAALWYKSMMEYWFKIRNYLPSYFYYEIKLETLVNSSEKSIRQLCEFTGLPFEDRLLEVNLGKSHIGRWEKEFPENEKMEISNILESVIYKLGY